MKKLLIILPLFIVLACSSAQSQSDFYGKWIHESEGSTMEYEITSTIFTSTWTPELILPITPIEKNTFEIFSWEAITNDNADTKADYPTGYLIGFGIPPILRTVY